VGLSINEPVIYYMPAEDFTFIAIPTEVEELVSIEFSDKEEESFIILKDELKKLKYYPMGYL